MILADVHTHTLASHGKHSVAAMCAAAEAQGLHIYGLSEHSPLPEGFSCPLYTGDLHETFPRYVQDVQDMQKKHAAQGSMQVLLGMELDWIPSHLPYMQELAGRYAFDYVIGGLHYVDGLPIGSPKSWQQGEDEAECERRFTRYYEEMAVMAASGLVQIVAHPDFIKLRCYAAFHRWLRQSGAGGADLEQHAPAWRAYGSVFRRSA